MSQTVDDKPLILHVGLACRHCGCQRFRTVYTRRRNDGIIRRKRCQNCGEPVTTREKIIKSTISGTKF